MVTDLLQVIYKPGQPIKFDVLSYNGCDDHCYRSWSWSLSNESDTCIFAFYLEHSYYCWFRN